MDSIIKRETGFFKQKHVEFYKILSQNEINAFANLKSDEERFKFVHKYAKANDYPTFNNNSDKSEAEAKALKDIGNKKFQATDYKAAFQFYTKAILKSPADRKEENSILRANRSAALYHLGLHKLALIDIQAAIDLNYPKDLLYKVKDRKARCLLALKQHKSALQAFRETIQALDDASIKSDRRKKWMQDVQVMLAMITKANPKDEVQLEEVKEGFGKVKFNPVYKAACKAVSIEESKDEGRYAVANSPISVGDVILTEEAHCAVLLEEHVNTHCFHCFTRLKLVEPCPKCCRVAFCSKSCLEAAMGGHHRYECPVLQELWASGASVTCLMALRIITQRPPQFFTALPLQNGSADSKCKQYLGSDYLRLYNLVRHEDRRSVTDLLHRAHMAVFLFNCLKKSNYLIDLGGDQNLEELFGGLLLRHLQLLQFNAHEVSELQGDTKDLDNSKSIFLGGAVYPTLALFNHSCNPSLTRYFQGTRVVARAVRNLNKGELVAENYGPIFTQRAKKERQEELKSHYWFDCRCEACLQDWPLLANMDDSFLRFRCQTKDTCSNIISIPVNTMEFMIRCNSCGVHINIMKGLKALQDSESLFRLGKSLMDEGNIAQALKKFIELLKTLDETLAPPFKDYHVCQQVIRTCFLTMGNMYTKGALI